MKRAVKGLLIDLDGVLYVGDQAIEGACEALERLAERGVPTRFVTNTTTRTPTEVTEKLRRLGFPVDPSHIFSAISATKTYLKRQGRGRAPRLHLLVRDSVRSEFSEFPLDETKPDFVVIGDIGAAWSYPLLNRSFQQLMSGARLVAMHKNKFFQTEQGLMLDSGAFVAALEYVSGQTAEVVGKPTRAFFQSAVDSLGLPAESVAMVGDDIDSDVGGGQAAGLLGVLVKTGKYRDAYAKASSVQPDLVLESIAELPLWV